MPKIKSAIKRVEVAERNRVRNKAWKSSIRTARSAVEELAPQGEAKALDALKEAYSLLDGAVSKGILHKNTAARRKSRLAVAIQKLAKTGK